MSQKYTKEFKEEAAKLVVEQGYSQAEAGRNLGVNPKNIYRWVKDLQTEKSVKTPDEQEELRHLRKEVAQLRLEREILKKAAAFFAREQN